MSDHDRAFVGVLVVDLHFPQANSLKAKRGELKSLRAALQQRFGAAVAEVGHQDRWQRSTLAVALTAGTQARLEGELDGIGRWLDARLPQGVRVRRRVVSLEDLFD